MFNFRMMRFSRLPRLVTWTLGIFFALATIAPLPYAIVLPGEAQNIFKGVITFKDLKNYPATGRIDLMSIRVTARAIASPIRIYAKKARKVNTT